MLDSGCMMLDDQGMTEEWIVRVHGTEYGPADVETLREWKAEGRLLPGNEARRADSDLWTIAAEIPGLFGVAAAGPASILSNRSTVERLTQAPLQQRRSLAQILTETFRIYWRGFFQFLTLTLLVLLPSVCSQLASPWMQTAHGPDLDLRALSAGSFAFLMFILSIAMWPVYVAGIQILADGIAAGHRVSLVAALNEAVRFWPRVAVLCVFVYGVFFLLTIFAFGIAVLVAAGASSLLLIFFALALLILQVSMFSSGSSLPSWKAAVLPIHCAKAKISRAADAIFRGSNVRCGAAFSSPQFGLRLCWLSRLVRNGRRCGIILMN